MHICIAHGCLLLTWAFIFRKCNPSVQSSCDLLAADDSSPLETGMFKFFWVKISSEGAIQFGSGRVFDHHQIISTDSHTEDDCSSLVVNSYRLLHENPKYPAYIRIHRNYTSKYC